MTISPYAISKLAPYITGDQSPPKRSGKQLVNLFNKNGMRDVYDELGLPDIKKKSGQRPSRTEYVIKRLEELSGKHELRELLTQVANEFEETEMAIAAFNDILNPETFTVAMGKNGYYIQGGIIDKARPVANEAHFQDIQSRILNALDSARVSVRLVMAWFTNEILFQKLVEKYKSGVDVQIAIYDDGVNRKHGVDISQLPHKKIKRGQRGGLMHNKFCVIDNQIVITGSYNWTDNAEFRNDENITVEKDPSQATEYSVEFNRLT